MPYDTILVLAFIVAMFGTFAAAAAWALIQAGNLPMTTPQPRAAAPKDALAANENAPARLAA